MLSPKHHVFISLFFILKCSSKPFIIRINLLIKLLLFPSDRFNDADDDLSYMETSYRQIEREEQKRLEI